MDSNILMIKINISGVISCKFMRQLRVNMTVQIWKKYSPNRKSTQNNYTSGFLMIRLKERGRVTDQSEKEGERQRGRHKERETDRERERVRERERESALTATASLFK